MATYTGTNLSVLLAGLVVRVPLLALLESMNIQKMRGEDDPYGKDNPEDKVGLRFAVQDNRCNNDSRRDRHGDDSSDGEARHQGKDEKCTSNTRAQPSG
jgi:hypothetical protein